MTTLIKFKNNTFAWTKIPNVDNNLTRSEAIALGYWKYKIPKSQIELGLSVLQTNRYDVAVFNDLFKIFWYAKKSEDIK